MDVHEAHCRMTAARKHLAAHPELFGTPRLALRSPETRHAWTGLDDAPNGAMRWGSHIAGRWVVLIESLSGNVRLA